MISILFIVRLPASIYPFIHGMRLASYIYAMQVACGLLGGYEIRFHKLGGRVKRRKVGAGEVVHAQVFAPFFPKTEKCPEHR